MRAQVILHGGPHDGFMFGWVGKGVPPVELRVASGNKPGNNLTELECSSYRRLDLVRMPITMFHSASYNFVGNRNTAPSLVDVWNAQ